MKVVRSAILSVFFAFSLYTAAGQQPYFLSKELKKAIAHQTRTLNGQPGTAYWQNRADYTMHVKVADNLCSLNAEATILYLNNSPDTLNVLVFNIYQDIYRKGNSRDWDIGTNDLHDGTRINGLSIDGNKMDVNDKTRLWRQGTKLSMKPEKAILPGSQTKISIHWSVALPSERPVRMGVYGDSAAFVAYWYPQIAVYDDIDGWDMISYGGSVEFYNEFGDYDVTIEAPEKYAVWAVGLLQNASQLFHPVVNQRIEQAQQSDEIVHVVDDKLLRSGQVFAKKERRQWHFKATNVPDFSFALGKGFCWDATSMLLDSTQNARTLVNSVYPHNAKGFDKVAAFSRQSIYYLSFVMPKYIFPYPSMTTFCNGRPNGGMETPMMANNGNLKGDAALFGVTFHEISHSYMPFFMGTNEKKYAWMDEGWAALWPWKMTDSLYPDYHYLENIVKNFENAAGKEADLSPMIPSQFMAANYASLRLASYLRPAMAYHFLEETLGNRLFLKGLHYYMRNWNGKHPLPLDFFRTFETVCDGSLDWFFQPWFFENAYPDLALKKITQSGEVVIENRGGLPLPVYLEVTYSDRSTETLRFGPEIWSERLPAVVIELAKDKKIAALRLGNDLIPDTNRNDNELFIID